MKQDFSPDRAACRFARDIPLRLNDGEAAPRGGARVGISAAHEPAHLHVAGAAPFGDDVPEAAGTLHSALAPSPVASGVLRAIDRAALLAWIVATGRDLARQAAARSGSCLDIEEMAPVLSAREAYARGDALVPPALLVRESAPGALAAGPHRLGG
jgi:xanthine dehydrogenase large subunit